MPGWGEGNARVILCERGIRTFETATRNTLDLSAVPVLRERTHLPVIVDPSHAAGRREWVAPLAHAARAVDDRFEPREVLEHGRDQAVRLMRDETRDAQRSKLTKEFLPQVWCLFDRDEHEGVLKIDLGK